MEERDGALDSRRGAIHVVLIYAAFAALWILSSDQVVEWLFSAPTRITLASTLKGWLFVLVTSLLLYGLLRRRGAASGSGGPAVPMAGLGPSFALWALVIVAFTAVGLVHIERRQREEDVARLQAIADLKVRQISDWLSERGRDAVFVQTSSYFAELYRRWRPGGDSAAGTQLQARLEQWRRLQGFQAITILDAEGRRLWGTTEAPRELAPFLRATVAQVAREGRVRRVGPYLGLAGHGRLDFVVPLRVGAKPDPVVVLHADPAQWLYPALQTWPAPSATGETLLFRREGDQVLFLNELRHSKDTALKLRRPVATPELLAAKVLRGEARQGKEVTGRDYRGVPAFGVVRGVPDTDWFLVAKLDRAELYEHTSNDVVWVCLVGLLALFMVGAGMVVLRQRAQLVLAASVEQSQSERLRALCLLAAIADSSEDAIFAKDLDGRFILFNRATGRIIGKPAEEALGRDAHGIFPAEQAQMMSDTERRVIAENRAITEEERLSTADGERYFLATTAPLHEANGKVMGIFGISRDITERKQAEVALNRLADDLSATLHAIPDLLFELDEKGRYIRVIAAQEPLLVAPAAQLAGQTVHDVLPPEAAQTVMDALAEAGRTGADYGRTIFLPLADGTRCFELSVARKSATTGQDQHFVVLSRDITERKQAQDALKEREARYRAVIETAADGFWMADEEGRFLAVNDAFVRRSGYSREELLTMRISDIEVQESPEEVRAHIQEIRREGSDLFETWHRTKDGETWPVEVNVSHWPEAGGRIFAFLRDITERKQAELELRQSESRFRTLFDNAAISILVHDRETGRIIEANHRALEVYGFADTEGLARKPYAPPPYSREDALRLIHQAAAEGPQHFEWLSVRSDGREFWQDVQLQSIHLDGVDRVLAVTQDITARKLAEKELRNRNKELERFNRAAVGRELDMVALKRQINELSGELGLEPPFALSFLDTPASPTEG